MPVAQDRCIDGVRAKYEIINRQNHLGTQQKWVVGQGNHLHSMESTLAFPVERTERILTRAMVIQQVIKRKQKLALNKCLAAVVHLLRTYSDVVKR